MPLEDWVEKVRQYRIALHAYCDAVDHMDGTTDPGQDWQQVEEARDVAERARLVLLRQRPKPMFRPVQNWSHAEVADLGTEEWVLGDVGQHGG
jgi:hypothetical protein